MKRLKLPKNKFIKLIISVGVVYFWLIPFDSFRIWLFDELCLLTGVMNPSDALCLGYYNPWISWYIIEPIGIIISLTYIWSEKFRRKVKGSPKITRSKD